MKLGDKILIIPSNDLIEYRLMALTYREGQIVEIRANHSGIFGAWVELTGKPYLNEKGWFIPVASIHILDS